MKKLGLTGGMDNQLDVSDGDESHGSTFTRPATAPPPRDKRQLALF